MLSITSKSGYGVSALVELARSPEGTPVPVAEIARKREVPAQFLEQICAAMRRGGLLRSQRGVKGGFLLAKPASDISVLEVVELLDGRLGVDSEGVFERAADAARDVLAATSIEEIAASESEGASPMYWI